MTSYIVPGISKDIKEIMKIDKNILDDECSDQPGLYAYWAAMSAETEQEYEYSKVELNQLEAGLDLTIRNSRAKLGLKATDKSVDSEMKRSQSWIVQSIKVARLKSRNSLFDGIKRAFAQRKDMLSALMYDASKEYRGLIMKEKLRIEKEA